MQPRLRRVPGNGGQPHGRSAARTLPARLHVIGLDADGDGVGHHEGRVVHVRGVLPGEVVEVGPPPPRAGAVVAALRGIVTPSPHRVVPRCPHTSECGGCSWQHIAYAEQLRLKRARVRQLLHDGLGQACPDLTAVAGLPAVGGTIDSPWDFRHKVHFVVVTGRAGQPALGHFRPRSRDAVAVGQCPVHAERGNRVARGLQETLRDLGLRAADVPGGLVRHLVVRVSAHEPQTVATVVVTDATDPRLAGFGSAVRSRSDSPDGLHLNEQPQASQYLFGPVTRRVFGVDRLRERVLGTSFLISPTAFFQTSVDAAELLVRVVLEAVPHDARRVLDLYAGCGLFSLPLARRGHEVVAVEESASAIGDGLVSRDANDVPETSCRFIRARVERFLHRRRASMQTLQEGVDAVVLDPPRQGCPPGVLEHVLSVVRPRVVVYVSCEPEALARDLGRALLAPGGKGPAYRVEPVQLVDMFPHTPHLEAIAVLARVR